MSILIIGAGGFIGSSLVRYFRSRGFDVAGADIFLITSCDFHFYRVTGTAEEWVEIFVNNDYKYCINAAGSSNVNDSLAMPDADFALNVKDTSAILEGIRLSGKSCRYIHISSAAVYGNPSSLPVKESDTCRPVSPYGWNKLMAEELCREYHSLYGLPIAIARPFSVYGPGLRKQLFWDIFMKWKKNPGKIELWGTGQEARDFIHINDLVRCFECLLMGAQMEAESYNIANGELITVDYAASLLMNEIDANTVIHFSGEEHAGNPLRWQADISSIQSLGFVKSVDFNDGIRDLAIWMLNQG